MFIRLSPLYKSSGKNLSTICDTLNVTLACDDVSLIDAHKMLQSKCKSHVVVHFREIHATSKPFTLQKANLHFWEAMNKAIQMIFKGHSRVKVKVAAIVLNSTTSESKLKSENVKFVQTNLKDCYGSASIN